MRVFFVDLENINASALGSIQSVTDGDQYYVFYSDACINMSEDAINHIREKGGKVKLFKIENGTGNALDFQLSSFMGYIIRENIRRNDNYFIVSCDKGYDVVCSFWREKGIHTYRITCFTNTVMIRKTITAEELSPYLDQRAIPYKADILHVLNNVGSTQSLYAGLGKIVRNGRRAGFVYRRIKPLFLSRFSDTETSDNSNDTGKESCH